MNVVNPVSRLATRNAHLQMPPPSERIFERWCKLFMVCKWRVLSRVQICNQLFRRFNFSIAAPNAFYCFFFDHGCFGYLLPFVLIIPFHRSFGCLARAKIRSAPRFTSSLMATISVLVMCLNPTVAGLCFVGMVGWWLKSARAVVTPSGLVAGVYVYPTA